ncbi:heterokaryon incompatibility protein-domain-containing protein [Phaeosphaeria sp. MPI-PUGE-AT-0046c]|nr:heterokaryon incompatibility protein-domain-containing protein [Phaeosphaeria sp. MPI-PUGE-AT-0046c]
MTYAYKSLLAGNSIRLLSLSPGSGDCPLEAQICIAKIEDGVIYEALSYVWGDSSLKKTLIVDGQSLLISDNLYSILLQLRQPETSRILWIDAVCINQQDTTERGIQVSMMGQIYRQADIVICWLGNATVHGTLAMDFLQNIARKADEYIEFEAPGHLWSVVGEQVVHSGETAATLASALEAHVEAIYDSSWFTRLWISQEVTLARKPIVYCGTKKMSWEELELATRVLACCHEDGRSAASLPPSINGAWTLIHTRARYRLITRSADVEPIHLELDTMWSLGRLAWESRQQHCKDDKDRVYALLSLVSDGSAYRVYTPKQFIPDYTRSVEWAYGQFWGRFGGYSSLFYAGISRRGKPIKQGLSLSDVGGGRCVYNEGHLPSWCPDLRWNPEAWEPIFTGDYAASTPMHHMECHLDTTTGPGPLMIRGHRFDVVFLGFHITRKFAPGSAFKDNLDLRKIVKMFVALQSAYGPYLSGQPWIDALGFALLTDVPSGANEHDHSFQSYTSERLTHQRLRRLWHTYLRDLISDTGTVWQTFGKHFIACFKAQLGGDVRPGQKFQFDPSTQLTKQGRLIWKLHEYIGEVLKRHRFIITNYNWMGLAPPDTAPGDVVVVLGGPGTAFIVRDTEFFTTHEIVPRTYESIKAKIDAGQPCKHTDCVDTEMKRPISQLLGPCYLQGIMNGELWQEERYEKLLEWETDRAGTIPRPTICLI